MCPLRVILIFLSATIAGFFLIRGLNAEPDQFDADDDKASESGSPRAPVPLHSKVTPPSPLCSASSLFLASCLRSREIGSRITTLARPSISIYCAICQPTWPCFCSSSCQHIGVVFKMLHFRLISII